MSKFITREFVTRMVKGKATQNDAGGYAVLTQRSDVVLAPADFRLSGECSR
ncbi:hypothetical protein PSCICN_03650 [Pseudomonas cichorii]|nr:hypothetical protein PSCICN_03650 [Pseudomonas cichorii]